MKVKPYQGNEPYIFISYSHKDTNKVMPIVERLDKDGYRIWYDDGIPTASHFNDVIAERIDSCTFMLLFVSDNYIASKYCNKELNFAEAENKKLIGIYARDVQLTPRFKMLRSAIQGIDEPYMYDDKFFEKLYFTENISMCQKSQTEKQVTGTQKNIKTVKYKDGSVYEGELKNGTRNGYGKMTHNDGRIIEGYWQDDDIVDGQVCTSFDGIVFEGILRNGIPNGKGKITFGDGTTFECNWTDGEPIIPDIVDKFSSEDKTVLKCDQSDEETVIPDEMEKWLI